MALQVIKSNLCVLLFPIAVASAFAQGATGIFPFGNTPRELEAWMREQIARWRDIAAAANIKAD